MIALFVLAIGLGAVAMTFNMAVRSVMTHTAQMSAVHAARDRLESLRNMRWSDAALASGTHAITEGRFAGTYDVVDSGPELKDVTVYITWPNELSRSHSSLSLSTTFAKQLHD
jgi:Tfp pilus assembly protein PilV